MCLKNASLNLTYNSELNQFVGRGYKVIEDSSTVLKGKRYSSLKARFGHIYEPGQWDRASSPDERRLCLEYHRYDGKDYPAGFHICLTKEDALKYRPIGDNPYYGLYECEFYEVRAFGEQELYGDMDENGNYKTCQCVVAGHIKIGNRLGTVADILKEIQKDTNS
jgi:hypothetical protein